jgi:16S rRNA processing protein RimM
VLHLPMQDTLEIETADGVRLVPFVSAVVPQVDLAAGRLHLADVPGLLTDLDEPDADEPDAAEPDDGDEADDAGASGR